MRPFIIVLFVWFITGCATTDQSQQTLANWRGKNVNDLVGQLGTPAIKNQAEDGNTNYTYVTKSYSVNMDTNQNRIITMVAGNQTIGVNAPSVPNPATRDTAISCLTTYEVDERGIIVDVQKKGDC